MTTTQQPRAQYRRSPLWALATAEYLQFRRNTTLVYLGTIFPVGIPLVLFILQHHAPLGGRETSAFELFALIALLQVQYYSVLSLITTRRGEGVLRRLRTGEAADWQIQAAPAVPGAVLTVIGAVVVAAVVYAFGAPAPVNPLALVLAVFVGLVTFSLLALATSAMTKNAEAAQITSIPVMALTIAGLGSIRTLLPDHLATIAGWTPFAAVSDLISLGTAGKLVTAGETLTSSNFAGSLGEFGRPVATLAIWAALALLLVRTCFKWDTRD